MHWGSIAGAALAAAPAHALLRFYCSQLVVERLDPLVNPGQVGTPHVHQIIGGVCQKGYLTIGKITDRLRTPSMKL